MVLGLPRLLTRLLELGRKSARFRRHFKGVAPEFKHVRIPRFALLAVAATSLELLSFFFLLRASFFPTRF